MIRSVHSRALKTVLTRTGNVDPMIAFVAIGDHVIGEADVGGSTGIEQRIDGAL